MLAKRVKNAWADYCEPESLFSGERLSCANARTEASAGYRGRSAAKRAEGAPRRCLPTISLPDLQVITDAIELLAIGYQLAASP
jgi:hypothetical protein